MDEWKEQAVMSTYENKLSLLNCIKDRIKHIKQHIIEQSHLHAHIFTSKLQSAKVTPNQFLIAEDNIIIEQIKRVEAEFVKHSIKYFALLEEKKRIESHKHFIQDFEIKLTTKLALVLDEINRFALHLEFETNAAVSLKQISKNRSQFARCRKAILNNLKPGFFNGNELYSSISLLEAYKIDNKILLTTFEDNFCKMNNASLKGLFCMARREQLISIITHGVSCAKSLEVYQQEYLRIPFIIYNEYKKRSKYDLERELAQAEGYNLPIDLSSYSTMDELRRDIDSQSVEDPELVYIVLCRVIVHQTPSTATKPGSTPPTESSTITYSASKESYQVKAYDLIYPEYILICKPVLRNQDPTMEIPRVIQINPELNPMLKEEEQFYKSRDGRGMGNMGNIGNTGNTGNTGNMGNMGNMNMGNSKYFNHPLNTPYAQPTSHHHAKGGSLIPTGTSSAKQIGEEGLNESTTTTTTTTMGGMIEDSHETIKRLNTYLENMNLQEKIIIQNIKNVVSGFWNKINLRVQKLAHPNVILQKNNVVPLIKSQITSARAKIAGEKKYTYSLETLAEQRRTNTSSAPAK